MMTDPLSYDSRHDPYLQAYFQNTNIRKHFRRIGLINRQGDIIPYKQYQTALNEQSRREHIRQLLSHGIVQRVIQLEKSRQANLRNQFETVAKRVAVENVKESRQSSRQLRQTDFILIDRPTTSVTNNYQLPQEQIQIINRKKETPSRLALRRQTPSSAKQKSTTRHKSPKIIKQNINLKDHCQITMIYLGPQTTIESAQTNDYQIMIMQQHCGGENLIVFKNTIKPNEKFSFESHRHSEYPFALTLYVNGLIDCRISVCCEYKHKLGIPLTGKRSSFVILNVQGRRPCQTCRFNEYMSHSPLLKAKSSDQNSISTDLSKSRRSSVTISHRLLRTPSPYNEQNNDTIISNSNQYDEIKQAKEMYESLFNKNRADLNWEEKSRLEYQLGNICKEGLGDFSKALEHYLISLEIACQHFSPTDPKLRNLYLSIGHILLLQGKSENNLSIEYFQRVLHIDYSSNQINEHFLTTDHYYLGLLHQNQDNFPQALFHFEKCLEHFLLINSKSTNPICFNQKYSFDNQTIYDEKVLESLSTNKLPNISEIHFNLAQIYQHIGQKQNAFKHIQKAIQLTTFDQTQLNIYQEFFKKLRLKE